MRAEWRRIALAIAALSLFAPAAYAASPKDELDQTQQDLEKSKARQAQLARDHDKLEAELADLQKQLVRAAAAVRKSEEELSATEAKLRELNEQIQKNRIEMAASKKRLDVLVEAALKLSRVPPEAALMMPGDIEEHMGTARTMRMSAGTIKREVMAIQKQADELAALEAEVTVKRDEQVKRQAKLDNEKKTLAKRQAERSAILAKLGREQREEAQRAAQLARKAADLQDLIETITRETRHPEQERGFLGRLGKKSFGSAKGRLKPPVSGRLAQGFGAALEHDGTSKGITIAARQGAQVTAPFEGEVVYAGPFLNYGKLVILRHSDEFHTLLAGLARIDAKVGDFLLEGEPIGAMGSRASESRLYVEIRKNNQPVNPASWISGLTSSD